MSFGGVAADLLRGGVIHIHAAHLDFEFAVRAPPDIPPALISGC